MVVQHNMQAMNANRQLGVTTGQQAKSTEKLSSGYKINRAADDAAGLSISEKMRKQIKGLDKASSNAQDGISAVQTAEGALTEVHSMLQRMNELATQASNGTNSETDRSSIQAEIDQLTTEIDRVAETTKFNETYLLKGNTAGTSSDVAVNAHDAGLAGKLVDNGSTATFTADSKFEDGNKITIAGKEYTIGAGTSEKAVDSYKKLDDATVTGATVKTGDSITTGGTTYTIVDKATLTEAALTDGTSAFTITHADGTTESYTVSSTAGDGVTNKADGEAMIKQALKNGEKVTLTADKAGNACDIEIVDKLDVTSANREISVLDAKLTAMTTSKLQEAIAVIDTGYTALKAGDVVSIDGKETTLTTNTPKGIDNVGAVTNALEKGDKIEITRNGGTAATITIADKTDEVNNKYTVADALNLIKDGDQVKFTIAATNTEGRKVATANGMPTVGATDETATYTVIGNGKATDSNVITKADALSKIADELAKASSIGTDTAATVKNNNDGTFTINKGTVSVKDSLSFSLHVGADADMTNKINVDLNSMSAAGLGIKGIAIEDESGTAATYAIDAIADAIATVSSQRSALGAVQNRLEHTIANLDNVVENTTSAESAIRDTDMAEEMVNYSKNNILSQAGQSMLAQANQSTQGVLSLLQ